MRNIIGEYGKIIIYVTIGILLLTGIYMVFETNITQNVKTQLYSYNTVKQGTNKNYTNITRPSIYGIEDIKINVNDMFDIIDTPNIAANDGTSGADITSKLLIYGNINGIKLDGNNWHNNRNMRIKEKGVFTLRYSIRDSSGFYNTKTVQVIAEPTPSLSRQSAKGFSK